MGERAKRKKLTLDQFVSLEYLPYIRKHLKSWPTSERILRRHVSPVFGHRKLCEIKRMEVQVWQQNMLRDGLTISTVNRCFAALKALCSYAELQGYLPFGMSPCYKISTFPNKKRTPYLASPDKIVEMFEALKQNDSLPAKALMLMILTDARKNEILMARWTDVNWENRQLRSTRDIQGTIRMIDLPEDAVVILKNMNTASTSDWIFPGRDETDHITDIYYFWNKFRSEMGIPQMRIDDLRYNNL